MGNCGSTEDNPVVAHAQVQQLHMLSSLSVKDAPPNCGKKHNRSVSDLSDHHSTTPRHHFDDSGKNSLLYTHVIAFTLFELETITKSFRSDYILGEGGFGTVYKGYIDENVRVGLKSLPVAVKVLNKEGFQGHREWLTEVNFLGQLRHPNLVKLIGYCCEDDHRLLVYEFMFRGSLENHLFRKAIVPLSWATRMMIALGAAKGLAFLHNAERPVIYRDFKTSNILLDSDYTAKLSDFGLAKAGPQGDETHVSTRVMGTYGYAAPEYPLPLKQLTEGLKATRTSEKNELLKLFSNVICIDTPKDEELLIKFNKQVEEDRRIIISRSNLNELHKVLEEHQLSCMDLLHVNSNGVILTKQKAEKIVGWAKNHYLSSCMLPSIKGERLSIPRESLEIAVLRLKEQEAISRKPSHSFKNLAKDEYESNFVSAVVAPGEIGVKFDDIGALEDVKKALNELVILPMRRPELFSHGNLLRPCKGILLFGPPGTGKTLLAKALATETGANFISITGSNLTSKWFGDAEKLTKALFSFAGKLAPVIIFVDEVDSLLGARGGAFEHEATRKTRNEFMAAWDGLRSKDNQRIIILGATNRPFDLDEAVIRRLPRRIYVDLPDAENRMKILRIFLASENIEPDFQFDELASATEGYSGSDLKNLSIAAAYRPVQELLEEEQKGGSDIAPPVLRPLTLDDFLKSKAKVGPSVAFDAASMNELRKWNEQYGEDGSRRKSLFGFGN